MGDHCSRQHDPRADTGAGMDVDEILDILCRAPRRDVIDICRCAENRQITFDRLVDEIVEKRRQRGDVRDADQVGAQLHHVHLPRLAEQGLLEYDTRNGDVRYWGHDRIETFLDTIKTV